MSSVYFNLAGGSLTQDWTNVGLITANDDWANVPSIVGYLGDIDTAGAVTNVDPRTLTGANLGQVDVIANLTAVNNTSGGVGEFEITNPVVALQGSGTADAPSLVLYLDATGRTAIRFTANIRDIDNTTDNATQQVAVQYRTDPAGAWINVPSGYIADATTVSTATQVTPLDVTLPAGADNAATLQIRILTTNAGGNDEWVGIDDIVVSSSAITGPGGFSIADVPAVAEGNSGATPVTFTVTRANGSVGTTTVAWALAFDGGSGSADAADFSGATSGTLTFADGVTSQTLTVNVAGDTLAELTEGYRVVLSAPTGGATILDGSATGGITNDDAVPIAVAVNDVSVAEGNSGATSVSFTVTRSGDTAGAFTVNYATADGSAVAGSDYVATSGTLSFAAGELTKTVVVSVTPDTVFEQNETFSLNLSGATNNAVLTDPTGLATITNDDVAKIHDIQGSSYFSPVVASDGITAFNTRTSFTVTVQAVVTAIDADGQRQGFFITEENADWDASILTSEGIFVMTRNDTGAGVAVSGVAVGDLVTVTAFVTEYRGFTTSHNVTTLVSPTFTVDTPNQAIPTLLLDASQPIPNAILTGVTPDYFDISDDAGDSFDATNYALSFYETIEGMLVTVPSLVVSSVGATVSAGEPFFKAYSTVHANAGQINASGGYTVAGDPPLAPPNTATTLDDTRNGGRVLHDGDTNPDIFEVDFTGYGTVYPAATLPIANITLGDRFGDVTGIVEFDFTDLKLYATSVNPASIVDTSPIIETTTLVANSRALTVATFNVENLDPTDPMSKFQGLAAAIRDNLGLPDILSIEEIQDSNGAATGSVTIGGVTYGQADATLTWQMLVDAVNTAAGGAAVYQWVDQEPVYNAEGGEQSGSIRVGFLYNTLRVQLGDLAANAPIEERRKFTDRVGDGVRDAGDRISVSDDMVAGISTSDWANTRKSLLGQFTFNGNAVFVTANHLPAKGGSGEFWQFNQNLEMGQPANAGWAQRNAIAEDIYSVLNYIQTTQTGAKLVSGGDYNDFYFYRPLEAATGYVFADGTVRNDGAKLDNLTVSKLSEAERYTYLFDGRNQAIDHIITSQNLAAVANYDVVHINSGNPTPLSDHDPALAQFDFRSFGETLNGTAGAETLSGFGGDDILDGRGGANTLVGGIGDDIYYVDSLDDVVTELNGEGFDEVRTTLANYVLPSNVERLTLLGTAGNDTFTGTAAPNTYDISQGGADVINSGDSNDGVFAGAALDAGDQIDGGAGTDDQVAIRGAGYAQYTLGAGNLVNVETLVVLSGSELRYGGPGTDRFSYNLTSVDANVATGQQLVVNGNGLLLGENLTFNGSAESNGSFLFYGGRGTDTLTGGAGNDGFFFGNGGQFGAGDQLNGGAGAEDQLGLRGDYAAGLTFGATTIAGIETIVLLTVADTRFATGGTAFSYNLTLNNGNVAGGATLTINANSLQANETATVNGSAELDGALRLFGGAGNDSFIGGAGNDSFIGGAGADLFVGGLGADTLTGGAGNDSFAYRTTAQSTAASFDRITDFTTGDLIDLLSIDANTLVAGNDSFSFIGTAVFGGTGAASAGQLRATFDVGTSRWLIEGDTDGNGVADLSIQVTTTNGHVIVSGDFIL